MTQNLHWKDIIFSLASLAAVYGAILSTINFFARRQENKPKIKVRIFMGNILGQFVCEGLDVDKLSDSKVIISMVNIGHRPVTLNPPGISFPKGQSVGHLEPHKYQESDVHFPHKIGEGEKCHSWMSANEVANYARGFGYKGTVKIRACCSDATGRLYRSNNLSFKIEIWSKS